MDSSTHFSDGDDSNHLVTKQSKPTGRKKTPWALIGGLSAGIVLALTATVLLFNHFRTQPEAPKPQESDIVEEKEQAPVVPKPEIERKERTPVIPKPPESAPRPAVTERHAAVLLNPHAILTLEMTDATLFIVNKAKPLPDRGFVVHKIQFPAGENNKDFAAGTLLPALAGLKTLDELKDTNFNVTLTPDELAKLAGLPVAKTMTRLSLGFELTDASLTSLRKFPKLVLLGCLGRQADDSTLARLAAVCPNLLSLNLGHVGTIRNGPGLEAIARLPLAWVEFPACGAIEPEAARVLAGMPKLGHLHFDGAGITDAQVRELTSSNSIYHLILSATKVTDEGFLALLDLKPLTTVNVLGTTVSAEAVAKFRAARPGVTIRWIDPAGK